MYTSLSLVYLVVALTFSSCTAHRKGWWNLPRRPAISLRRLHCDTVEQFDLCSCCPVDPCNDITCFNGGQCVDGSCECKSGYSGPTCNINPCDGVVCLNGGQCVGEGVCDCVSGYSGPTCNINACDPSPCINGGTCNPTNNGCFTCMCPVGFTGIICHVNPCDDVQCLNGGQCVDDGVCNCTSGFVGATCNVRLDPCEDVVCLNGGQCVGEGVCDCAFGFGGATCNMRVCHLTECKEERDGRCYGYSCLTNVASCGGEACDKVCIDDTCVVHSENCGLIGGISNSCPPIGVSCGEGFCRSLSFDSTKCVNDTCRLVRTCDEQNESSDETTCSFLGSFGSCTDGVCLVPCSDDDQCRGLPCVGGFCADVKCGESYCLV